MKCKKINFQSNGDVNDDDFAILDMFEVVELFLMQNDQHLKCQFYVYNSTKNINSNTIRQRGQCTLGINSLNGEKMRAWKIHNRY